MKSILILGIVFLVIGCNDNTIILPQGSVTAATDLKDKTLFYFYFKTQAEDTILDIKKPNPVTNSNWCFTIDNRLPLRKVLVEIKKMQTAEYGNLPKSQKPENYFCFTDTIKESVAFFCFTKSKFKFEKPEKREAFFYLDRNDLVHYNEIVFSKTELQSFLNTKIVTPSSFFFAYDKGMSFGKYLEYKFFIQQLKIPKSKTFRSNRDYIY